MTVIGATLTGPLSAGPLRPTDVLAAAELAGPAGAVSVRYGHPLLHPAFPGVGSYGVLFTLDVTAAVAPTSVWVEATFDDRRVVANRVFPDGDSLGLVYGGGNAGEGQIAVEAASVVAAQAIAAAHDRPDWLIRLAHRTGTVRTLVTGTGSHRIRWVYNDPTGRLTFPSTFAMHAALTVPAGLTGLSGRLRVGVGRERTEAVPFAAAVTRPAVAAPDIRLCLGLRGIARMEPATSRGAEQIDHEWFTFPVGVDERTLTAALLNDVSGTGATVVLHRAPDGRPGPAVRRILDAVPRPVEGVTWVLPEVVFQDVVAPTGGRLSTEDFHELTLTEPGTGLQQQIWLHVPPR